MKRNEFENAMGQVRQDYIASAAEMKKVSRRPVWIGALAAVLVVAVLLATLWPIGDDTPGTEGSSQLTVTPAVKLPALTPYLTTTPSYPVLHPYPAESDDYEVYSAWRNDQNSLRLQPPGYADTLDTYFNNFISLLASQTGGKNLACSPVNIYMALAMLAESTDGESRRQILDLLGADSIEDLREQAGHVWLAHYNNDGLTTSILGSSLWLHQNYAYNEETAQLLADHYYASVFRGDLGSPEMSGALRSWLNEQTGGLLQDQIQSVAFDPTTILALATTIQYQVQWINWFQEESNTEATFHGTAGSKNATFMNTCLLGDPYFWGDNFSAVYLSLEGGDRMWLFLPDEGYTPEEIAGDAMEFLTGDPFSSANRKEMLINLSMPKFDVCSDLKLNSVLQELGINDVFTPDADFSPILPNDDGGYVNSVQHAARVAVDEHGVTASAYTLILYCGSALPPSDQIDFTLDRPFFFAVESQDGLPLFTGIVNNP